MPSMDFFRRPALAGNNLSRLTYGTIRGGIRRNDIDGFSIVPYFPGVSLTQTLLISIDGGGPVTASLSGTPPGGISNVIADINTALGVTGTAFDADGTIGIKTATAGFLGSVEVTGGSAAAALGFDTAIEHTKSGGGDITSSPEGRVGNWFGVAFPGRGENSTSESMTRSLARISSNSDVLYSDHVRADALPKKTPYTTSGGRLLIPTTPNAVRVFTGLGVLSGSTVKEKLAPFYFLIDTVTNMPPASRVVGVVRGSPGGLPPFANATTWTGGGATGNVLGQDLVKSNLAITNISNGRVLDCPGATFVTTSKVVPGDFVEIAGATNLTPSSNNGYRWVVEEVLTEETLAVRPMSSSEQAQFGPVTTEVQPIVELNGHKTGAESYGTAIVRNGTFCNDVQLVVDPPIPTGATYDLYAAVPGDLRSKKVGEGPVSSPMNTFLGTDLRTLPNMLISPPTITSFSSTTVVMTEGYARFNGRVVHIPARTWANTDFDNTGTGVFTGVNFLFWNEDTGNVEITRSPVKVFNAQQSGRLPVEFAGDTPASNQLIAEVVKTGANIVSVTYTGRASGEAVRVVTVGVEGQFQKLEDALNHINEWDKNQSQSTKQTWTTSGPFTDRYSNYEIALTSDVTVTGALPEIGMAGLRIRGVTPDINLIFTSMTGSYGFQFVRPGRFTFENLTIKYDASVSGKNIFGTPVSLFSGAVDLELKGVNFFSTVGSNNFSYLITGVCFGKILIDGCNVLNVGNGLLKWGDANTYVTILNSKFSSDVGAGDHQLISSLSGPTADWTGQSLYVNNCVFNGFGTSQGPTAPVFGRFANQATIENCYFSGSNPTTGLPASADSLLFYGAIGCLLRVSGIRFNGSITMATRLFLNSNSDESFVEHVNIPSFSPVNGGDIIKAAHVSNCFINGIDPGAGKVPGYGIRATRTVECCEVYGSLAAGIISSNVAAGSSFSTRIAFNHVELFKPTVGNASCIVAHSYGTSATRQTIVEGNVVAPSGTGSIGIQLNDGVVSGLFHGNVSGNTIRLATAAGNNGIIGIDANHAQDSSVVGNHVLSATGSYGAAGPIGIRAEIFISSVLVGNTVDLLTSCKALRLGGDNPNVSANYFIGSTASIDCVDGSITRGVIDANILNGAVTNIHQVSFTNNNVTGTITSSTTQEPFHISDNVVSGLATFTGFSSTIYDVTNNKFSGGVTAASGWSINFRENLFNAGTVSLNLGVYSDVSHNLFQGAYTASINAGELRGNVFKDTGTFTSSFGNMRASDNYFTTSGAVIFDGGSGGSQFILRDNYFSGSASMGIFGDNFDSTYIELDGNYFQGITSLGIELTRASNNTFINCTLVVLTGGYDVYGSQAVGVGNFFISGTFTATNVNFSGCTWDQTANVNLTDCAVSSSSVTAGAGFPSFTNCEINTCTITSTGVWVQHYINCNISGSNFSQNGSGFGCQFTSSAVVSGSTFDTPSGAVFFGGAGMDYEVSGSRFTRNITADGQNFFITGCEILGVVLLTTAGRVLVSGTQVAGAFTATGNVSCQLSGSTLFGNVSVGSSGLALFDGLFAAGDFAWSSGGELQASSSFFGGNFTTTLTASSSAQDVSLTSCIIDKSLTVYGNKYLYITGCSIGYDGTAGHTLKSGFATYVSSSTFHNAAGFQTVFQGNTFVSGKLVGNSFNQVLIDGDINDLAICDNYFTGGAIGTTLYIPLHLTLGAGTDSFNAGGLTIDGNQFFTLNGLIAGTTVQAPCIQLGDSSANVFYNVVCSNNKCWMTTRTSTATAANYACIQGFDVRQSTFVGNVLIRMSDANNATNYGIYLIKGQNITFAGNNSFNHVTLGYSADPNAQGGTTFAPGYGIITLQ